MLPQTAIRSLSAKAQGKLPLHTFTASVVPGRAVPNIPSRRAAAKAPATALRRCTCRSVQDPFSSLVRRRSLSTSRILYAPDIPKVSALSDREYHEIADETMDRLVDRLEALQEELDKDEFDVEYSSGVLTVKLPYGHGTYVVNKQPPNKQIWLSSPTSGPKRYDWSSEATAWFYARDGTRMLDLLESELSEKLRTTVDFRK